MLDNGLLVSCKSVFSELETCLTKSSRCLKCFQCAEKFTDLLDLSGRSDFRGRDPADYKSFMRRFTFSERKIWDNNVLDVSYLIFSVKVNYWVKVYTICRLPLNEAEKGCRTDITTLGISTVVLNLFLIKESFLQMHSNHFEGKNNKTNVKFVIFQPINETLLIKSLSRIQFNDF